MFNAKKYAMLTLTLLVISLQFVPVVNTIFYREIYVLNGMYTGIFEIVASGIFVKNITVNSTSSGSGILRVNYEFEIWIHVLESNNYTYIYSYRLIGYKTWSRGFNRDLEELINATLDKYLGRTIISSGKWVDPALILTYDLNTKKLYFERFNLYYDITAVSLYEDTVCFEYKKYNELILNNKIHREIKTFYYDSLSKTPLYLYDYYAIIDLTDDLNHFYIKRVIFEDGIGHGLSKISRSKTKLLYYDDSTGKISFVSYFSMPDIELKYENNTLYINLKAEHPYLMVIVLENHDYINYSSIRLKPYMLRTKTLYLSDIRYTNSTLTFIFNEPIVKITDQQGNATYIHEVTTSEKNYSSSYILFYTIVFNILAIVVSYSVSKFIARVLKLIVQS
ncbi:MAG: hypothetical protein B6U89_05000 [Desulfurococcales archaeon ex4484_58]|nr:MAG: hypothetical protein B6U89_05000 [Desulfurococcales archaeon ex4484_58]